MSALGAAAGEALATWGGVWPNEEPGEERVSDARDGAKMLLRGAGGRLDAAAFALACVDGAARLARSRVCERGATLVRVSRSASRVALGVEETRRASATPELNVWLESAAG